MAKIRTAAKKKILIIEDHPLFCDILTQLIEKDLKLAVCGCADNNQDAMALIERTRPDAAIVDLILRGSCGIEFIKDLRARRIPLPVLVLSMQDEDIYAERVLRAGARGFISKQQPREKVLEAIRKVVGGGTYISDRVTSSILDKMAKARETLASAGSDLLSDREVEVFQCIGQALTKREISKRLRLEPSTVDSYRARIKRKLGLKNGAQLQQRAAQWVANGLE